MRSRTTVGVSRGKAEGSSATCDWSKVNAPCLIMSDESFWLAFIVKTCRLPLDRFLPDLHATKQLCGCYLVVVAGAAGCQVGEVPINLNLPPFRLPFGVAVRKLPIIFNGSEASILAYQPRRLFCTMAPIPLVAGSTYSTSSTARSRCLCWMPLISWYCACGCQFAVKS